MPDPMKHQMHRHDAEEWLDRAQDALAETLRRAPADLATPTLLAQAGICAQISQAHSALAALDAVTGTGQALIEDMMGDLEVNVTVMGGADPTKVTDAVRAELARHLPAAWER